jgi:hypothetical protein
MIGQATQSPSHQNIPAFDTQTQKSSEDHENCQINTTASLQVPNDAQLLVPKLKSCGPKLTLSSKPGGSSEGGSLF